MRKLHKGDTVKLSPLGVMNHVGPRNKEPHATVAREPQNQKTVTIRWDGQKSHQRYSRSFLTLVCQADVGQEGTKEQAAS